MKKPVFCLLAILFLGGMVRAEDSAKSLIRVSDQARFSRDRVAPEVNLEVNVEVTPEGHWKLHRAQRGGVYMNGGSNKKWLMITGIDKRICSRAHRCSSSSDSGLPRFVRRKSSVSVSVKKRPSTSGTFNISK